MWQSRCPPIPTAASMLTLEAEELLQAEISEGRETIESCQLAI